MSTAALTVEKIAYFSNTGRTPASGFNSNTAQTTYAGLGGSTKYVTIMPFTRPALTGTLSGGSVSFSLPIVLGGTGTNTSVTLNYGISGSQDNGTPALPAFFSSGTVTFTGLSASIQVKTFTSATFNPVPSTSLGTEVTWFLWLWQNNSAGGNDFVQVYKSSYHAATLNYSAATAPAPPAAVNFIVNSAQVSGNIISENAVGIYWSGSSAGIANTLQATLIEYSESVNSVNWTAWAAYVTISGTALTGSYSISPPTTRGNFYKYRIRVLTTAASALPSTYSAYKESYTLRRATLPAAPTSFFAVSDLLKGYIYGGLAPKIIISWSGTLTGTGAIARYDLAYANSTDGTNWSGWTTLASVTTSNLSADYEYNISAPLGTYTRYRVIAVDVYGLTTAAAVSNSIQNVITQARPPAYFAVSSTVSTGDYVDLIWSGAVPGQPSGIAGYGISWRDSADGVNWGAWSDGILIETSKWETSGSIQVLPPNANKWFRQFRIFVASGDAPLFNSDYFLSTNTLRKDLSHIVPVVLYPANAAAAFIPAFNPAPVITLVNERVIDGSAPKVTAVIDGGTSYNNEDNPDMFYFNPETPVTENRNKILKFLPPSLPPGEHTIIFYNTSAAGSSNQTLCKISIQAAPPTDEIQANITVVQAEHMHRFFDWCKKIYTYYGLNTSELLPLKNVTPIKSYIRDWWKHMKIVETALLGAAKTNNYLTSAAPPPFNTDVDIFNELPAIEYQRPQAGYVNAAIGLLNKL